MRALPSRSALVHCLCLAVAIGACSSPTTPIEPDADAQLVTSQSHRGVTLDGLRRANWDCQQRGPSSIACAPPGIGLPPIPSLGQDGRALYQLAVFQLDGTYFGSAHFL